MDISWAFLLSVAHSMKAYLQATPIIDYHDSAVQEKASSLAKGLKSDEAIAKNCFHFVRDEIAHSGDIKAAITTCKASEVLREKTGWCYAKSHLLAALLRANGIPTGFCYQRLSCSEYKKDIYCLHGLNWIYLKAHGWYRVDARGNKEGVDARFTPPTEQLAFSLQAHEFDLLENLTNPLDVVVKTLERYASYEEMICHFPDVTEP